MSNKRVTGLGGIFFKSEDPDKIREWYRTHLGIQSESWGAVFPWRDADNPEQKGYTAWSLFKMDSNYFAPAQQDYMLNYRVENLDELLPLLESEGVTVLPERENSEFGKFAWILDPEGRKIELWEDVKKA